MSLDLIDVCVVVQGVECQQRWPKLKVSVDSHDVYCGTIAGMQKIKHQCRATPNQQTCVIDIEYMDKSDSDTQVDSQGNILSNQSVLLVELWINGVDIIKSGLIHQNIGQYTMNLSAQKQQYFVDHNIDIRSTTNTHMFENGRWQIELALPLLTTLTSKHNFVEPWEKVDLTSIVDDLYQQLKVCQNLEHQLAGNQL